MLKKNAKSSISEDDEEAQSVNENGKRSGEEENKEPRKRLKTKSLYRQPTVNELNRLQETENLFNSNLFRLQVEEILEEVKVKEKTEKQFTQWFNEFKTHLLSIPEDNDEYDLTENTLFQKLNVKNPVDKDLTKSKCMFKFHKFKEIEIVGSYALGCPINSNLRIDLQITVPAETYTKNDSINYKYHMKRAAYLAVIASYLRKSKSIGVLKFAYTNGSESKPVFEIKPVGKLGNQVTIMIDLVSDPEAYKLPRFHLDRNNLRETWLSGESSDDNTNVGPPTPYYNHTVLRDLTGEINKQFLSETLQNSENLKQAVVLLKIWLRQRNLLVSGYVVSMLVAYLVQTKRINNVMSSYQIVRNVWIALKTSELDTKGISLYKGKDSPAIEDFLKHFPVVFLDKTGYYNICWQMSAGTYNALKRESEIAVNMLDNAKINSFISLFMTPVKPLTQFDHILRFKSYKKLKTLVLNKVSKEAKINYGVDQYALVTDTVYALLNKGLGARAKVILPIVDADSSWLPKQEFSKMKQVHNEKLAFGIILNPENAMNTVEKGPPANLPEAEEFRAFWGDKSDLRRFQDGSITETCVWRGNTIAEQRTVTKQIINYLMNLKFDINASDLFHICDQLDSVTARKQFCDNGVLYVEESSLKTLQTFDALRRDLRHLTQLPLEISAVYGVSSTFSYSDPVPPVPVAPVAKPWIRGSATLVKQNKTDGQTVVPEYTPVCKAIVELGHSGKWPGDLQAFRCVKAAFHAQLATRLAAQCSLPAHPAPTHVDVLKDGLVFRLEIAHPKEITLARRVIENGVVKLIENEESTRLQCETVLLPRLRGALHGLHQQHPSFGPSACLFRRWLSSHLLSPPLFPPTMAELMVAAVFLRPEPLQPPSSPTVGFIRTLTLLAKFAWDSDFIFLDFNEDMSREEIAELEQKLSSEWGNSFRVRIVTAYDGSLPGAWAMEGPSEQVLRRARDLAHRALVYLEKSLLHDNKDNILGMFVPSYVGFDALIHLNPDQVPHYKERLDRSPQAMQLPEAPATEVIPVVEFHPVNKYLEELRSAFSEFAVFFHDLYGGDVIAVLWKPDINDHREFNMSFANALKPVTVEGETKYKVNVDALLEDFRIMGEGLVRDVTPQ